MASRELRRHKKKKSDLEKTLPAERRSKRPLLYLFSIIILIIIVVTFVGGPLLSGSGSGNPFIFGKYANQEIRFVDGNYMSEQVNLLNSQLRDENSAENDEYQLYQTWKGAFDRTVIRTAILLEAERSGLNISDNLIDEALLQSGPYFENGQFSEKRYKSTSNSQRARYRRLYRDDLIHQKYLTDVRHFGIMNSKEIEFVKEMGRTERKFQYTYFLYSDFPAEQVAAYGMDNQELFSKIKLSRINIKSSLSDAEQVRTQITERIATFEDQAKNYSQDAFADKGGEMGWREYNVLSADFPSDQDLDSLFSMSKDDVSPVYETSYGWIFFRIDEEAVEPDFTDEESISLVRSYMERFERGRIEDYLMLQAGLFLEAATGSSFIDAAFIAGKPVFETNFFPLNYGNTYFFNPVSSAEEGQNLGNAAYDELFFEELFSLEMDEVSEPLIIDNQVVLFKLLEIKEAADADLEFFTEYYPFIAQQYREQDLTAHIFASDELENNFNDVFERDVFSRWR